MKRRLPAEWEPQSAIQFTLPHVQTGWAPYLDEALATIARCITLISQRQKVLVVCQDIGKAKRLLSDCTAEQLTLVNLPCNDVWARDHGPITVVDANGPLLLDFTFNGWGLKYPADCDNQITMGLWKAGVLGEVARVVPGLVLEGGAIESDGQGTLLTTKSCLLSPNRNPHLNWEGTRQILSQELGVDRIFALEYGWLEGDDTDGHIDTLARFCNENTIAYVQCEATTDPHFTTLQRMEEELKQLRTRTGSDYTLVPLPLPDPCFDPDDGHRLPATYVNFLITNYLVIVPTYAQAKDQLALERLQAVFPERQVVGLDARTLIRQHGAIHCLTMQYPSAVAISSTTSV